MIKKMLERKRNQSQKQDLADNEGNKDLVKRISEKFSLRKKQEDEDAFQGDRGFTDPFGYQDEDAYLFVGHKRVISVFDVLIQYGTNNPREIGWLLDLIPKEEIESGRVIFVQRQKGMKRDMEEDIVEKHIESNIETMSGEDSGSAKEKARNSARVQDMSLSATLSGEGDSI